MTEANHISQALRALWKGKLDDDVLREPAGGDEELTERGEFEQMVWQRWLASARVFLTGAPPPGGHQGAALGRLLCLDELDGQRLNREVGKKSWRRGEVAPLKVDRVSLPDGTREPCALTEISESCREYLLNPDRMLKTPAEVDATPEEDCYEDPALRDASVRMELLRRLYLARMLRSCAVARGFVGIFAVVKKVEEDGEPSLRLIFDQRRGNRLWKEPPWTAMGGASSMAWLDFSAAPGEFVFATGDVPDYYHGLEIPAGFSEYFVFEGVCGKGVADFMKERGETCELVEGPVGLRTTAMGWSWAVFLAQTCLRDMVTKGGRDKDLAEKNCVIEGAASPILGPGAGYVHCEYVDDFGVFGTEAPGEEGRIRQVYERGASNIRAAGLCVHKEVVGESGRLLGFDLGPGPWLRPPAGRWYDLKYGALYLAKRKRVEAKWVDSVVGMLSWIFMLQRGCYSVFQDIYGWLREHRDEKGELTMPSEVRCELAAAAKLVPLVTCDMGASWDEVVLMTDASEEGGAVVATTASAAESRDEARWAPRGGWTTFLGNPEELRRRGVEPARASTESESDDGEEITCYRVAVLWGGARSDDDFEDWITKLGAERGIYVKSDVFDESAGRAHDPNDPDILRAFGLRAGAGDYDVILVSVPRSTWSLLRYSGLPGGPPPLRSRTRPWGLERLGAKASQEVEKANEIVKLILDLAAAAAVVDTLVVLEFPEDSGREPYPSLWATSEWAAFEDAGWRRISFDLCAFGAALRSPTTLAANDDLFGAMAPRRCRHRGGHPGGAGGKRELPRDLCRDLAAMILDRMGAKSVAAGTVPRTEWLARRAARSSTYEVGDKLPVPAVGENWSDIRRWTTVYEWRWKETGHINVLELLALLSAIKHKSRAHRSWGARHLFFVDSQVTLGAVTKGRSSRRSVNHVCRKIAALTVGLGMRIYVRWVPTKRNYADGPSRGWPLGVAPESVPARVRLPRRSAGGAHERGPAASEATGAKGPRREATTDVEEKPPRLLLDKRDAKDLDDAR